MEVQPIMTALFNSLKRNNRYTFVFGHVPAVTGVLHELLPDGTLLVAGTESGIRNETVHTYRLNPATILYARDES
jgi:hypothetical protein